MMNRFMSLLALFLAVVFALESHPVSADPADIEAASRGVVRVIIVGRDGEEIFPVSHGTGFAVGPERIVTNAHVVAQAVEDDRLSIGIVPSDGKEAVYARIVVVSQQNDLALLATTESLGLPPMTIAGNPARNGAVTAIGYPLNVDRAQGLSFSDMFRAQPPVTATGFLSGRRPSRDFDTLLHTAPIARGNSGGPLVDDCGRVIGVNSFGAESAGSDAEFFFAVSTRELLPFLRANGVTPRINSSDCRSLESLDAEERARRAAAQADADRTAEQAADQIAAKREEARRMAGYEVLDERANGMALAFLLLIVATIAGSVAALGHLRKDYRTRAIAGAIALAALLGAVLAWFSRPAFAEIDTRMEDAITGNGGSSGADPDPETASLSGGPYQCVLDVERSRVIGDPIEDMDLGWTQGGCVNDRTQYGLSEGRWTRVFVPANEATVSVNSFEPDAGQFTMERYLLDNAAMTEARAARGRYNAPSCEAGADMAQKLGSDQRAIAAALPERPNERLVYRCTSGTGD